MVVESRRRHCAGEGQFLAYEEDRFNISLQLALFPEFSLPISTPLRSGLSHTITRPFCATELLGRSPGASASGGLGVSALGWCVRRDDNIDSQPLQATFHLLTFSSI
jgi:hypothetical protein